MTTPEEKRLSLIARAKELIGELQDLIDDQNHWTRMHPDEEPLDTSVSVKDIKDLTALIQYLETQGAQS